MIAHLVRLLARLRGRRVRLLPIAIFCAAFTLTLKLGALWQGLDHTLMPAAAVAQEKAATPAAPGLGKPKEANAVDLMAKDAKPVAPGDAKKDAADDVKADKDGRGDRSGRPNAWFDPSLITDSELDVLQKLATRRAELEKRGREVETRERLLQATEKRINAKLAELQTIQTTIQGLLAKHDKQREEQLRSVVKIYENMKPKDAARIFDELDMAILLDVFERMREAKTAPVLAGMNPAKAKAVTAAMTQRRSLPKPKQQTGANP